MWQDLYRIPKNVTTRWATSENPSAEKGSACLGNDGRKRNPCIAGISPGDSVTLLDIVQVSGTIRRIWMTTGDRSPSMLRGLRIRIYWDACNRPAVDAPLGDFFCHGLGEISTFENALFSSPEARSFNMTVPMPFRTGARITLTNETDREVGMLFYEIDFTIGESHGVDVLYFHAHWRRSNLTRESFDFEILPSLRGRGRYLGVIFGVAANQEKYFRSWWGEGEVKIYLDGDETHPTLCGTGTEDYIGTG